ncbi:hypothetical protein DF268_17830 [Streptomyces sp. V2]|nr:hypothetical protein DF268_17830 [Streptomyces sp. V2]
MRATRRTPCLQTVARRTRGLCCGLDGVGAAGAGPYHSQGYLDGAVESGERVAREVLTALGRGRGRGRAHGIPPGPPVEGGPGGYFGRVTPRLPGDDRPPPQR